MLIGPSTHQRTAPVWAKSNIYYYLENEVVITILTALIRVATLPGKIVDARFSLTVVFLCIVCFAVIYIHLNDKE